MSEVPGLTSKYYSCRKPLVLPEGHQNVGIGISPKELRLGFDESRKCTPLRHSDRSRHTQGTVAVAPRVGPVRCPACSQSNFVQPVHQRGIRHNNATNTLSSSPLFAAAGGASAGNSRGQAGRSCNLPASFNQAKVHQHSRPRPPAATSVTRRKGRLPKVSRRGDDVVDVLAAKSAFLEAGLRDVMERLDEHQSELHNVTCLLHKLVLSSTHCGP
uniref:WGS project CAEQ00000000 data, annotated contig 1706 n=1 Tax=Trypanosoma congolense (strain IL3000) TaxID=1068625 RepID=F9W850_TRYCI|nr:unnamed protein product [Trypanosoma congolense IL3000]